jgi:hypothetical protein
MTESPFTLPRTDNMLPLIAVQEHYTVLSNPVFWIHIHWVRIRIQHFRLNNNPDPGFWWLDIEKIYSWKKNLIWSKLQFTGSRVLMTRHWKNLQLEKKFDLIKTAIYLFLASIKYLQGTSKAFSPQKRTSGTSNHESSFHIFLYFCG